MIQASLCLASEGEAAALLDRVLALYGPEAAPLRARFRELIEEAVRQMWSTNPSSQAQLAPNVQAGNALLFHA